jgi:hypothetical protein
MSEIGSPFLARFVRSGIFVRVLEKAVELIEFSLELCALCGARF